MGGKEGALEIGHGSTTGAGVGAPEKTVMTSLIPLSQCVPLPTPHRYHFLPGLRG